MSMDEFIKTLTEEQKSALLKALSGGEVADEPFTTHPPFIAGEKVVEDFTMHKRESNGVKNRRKEPVKARQNTWSDTGEFKEVSTPDVQRTPRNRPAPKKKEVKCSSCGKTSRVNANIVYGEYYRCERCVGTR